jgi:hypothetical protein
MNRPSDVPDQQLTLARVVRAWRNGENVHVPAELLESASPGLRLALTGLARRQRYQVQAATSNPKAPSRLLPDAPGDH